MLSDEKSSDGKTDALHCFGEALWRPLSSQKFQIPTNSRRAFVEHSKTCAEVQNSGLIVR